MRSTGCCLTRSRKAAAAATGWPSSSALARPSSSGKAGRRIMGWKVRKVRKVRGGLVRRGDLVVPFSLGSGDLVVPSSASGTMKKRRPRGRRFLVSAYAARFSRRRVRIPAEPSASNARWLEGSGTPETAALSIAVLPAEMLSALPSEFWARAMR